MYKVNVEKSNLLLPAVEFFKCAHFSKGNHFDISI